MSADSATQAGCENIVRRFLELHEGQRLLILIDETTVDVGVMLAEAAARLRVQTALVLVPMHEQRRFAFGEVRLTHIETLAKESRALITCVNGSPECYAFRDHIIETNNTASRRIGHMPGATPDVLRFASGDVEQLIARCRQLEWALARGRRIEVVTRGHDGAAHTLTAAIDGWDRLPIASDGVIKDGMWANVPSGETYIAPMEGTAAGSVVINGSIPGRVIGPGEEIVLHFEGGCLVAVTPDRVEVARLFDQQFEQARALGDPNWANLAEIGIGVNDAVRELTGNMLIDEKAAGTAHVALGDSTHMGGAIAANVHCDVVFRQPTVRIDGRTIIDRGAWSYVESEWRENYLAMGAGASAPDLRGRVARSAVDVEVLNGRLMRALRPGNGRKSHIPVGDDETARLARDVYDRLPRGADRSIDMDVLVQRLRNRQHLGSDQAMRGVLAALLAYELITIEDRA